MVFLPHISDSNVYFNVQLDGVTINKVNTCSYLGLIIDDELKWTKHICHIYHYLLKNVGKFHKLRSKIPASVMKNVYYALFTYMYCMELKSMLILILYTLIN